MLSNRTNDFWQCAWLTGAVLITGLPHFRHVPLWITALVTGAALWRLLAADKGWRLPPASIRIPLVVAGFAGVLWQYHRISGVEAGSALLLVMLALKFLETRGRRDRMLMAMICFILMFASFLREQAIWSSAYLLGGVGLGLAALLQSGTITNRMPVRAVGAYMLQLVAQALPLMAILFVLFPRVPGPFWALPTDTNSAMTGLGDKVSPGDITRLGQSDAVAFRVRFEGPVPEAAQRYWRGPVMSYFDGRAWTHRNRGLDTRKVPQQAVNAPAYNYEITLEPHGRHWLLALESPVAWNMPTAIYTADWQLIDTQAVNERTVYRASSVASATLPGADSERYLQAMRYLPPDSNPGTRQLARELRGKNAGDFAYLTNILQYFRNRPFSYTLTPAALGQQPVDEFLFDTQEGFCEHYASAFAVLARAGGIPARVVTGYLGAERNPVGDHWVVRQSDAHAWTEVWVNGAWHRYDPTSAVAPERIELGLDEAIPEAGRSLVSGLRRSAVLGQMALSLDAINAAWDRWILGFGPDAQRDLLRSLGFDNPNLSQLLAIVIGACGVFIAWITWLLARGERLPEDRAMRLWQNFGRKLARRFRAPRPQEAPTLYAAEAAHALPHLQDDINEITRMYVRLRYETATSEQSALHTLRNRIRNFSVS